MLSRVSRRWSSSISPLQTINLLRHRQLLEDYTKLVFSFAFLTRMIYCRCDESIAHVDGSSVYVGFDPTADSLHIGNLVTVMAMLHFQRAGYQPLAVVRLRVILAPNSAREVFVLQVGGATGIIGDPSGRSTNREPLHLCNLEQNMAGISATLKRIFQNANCTSTALPALK